MEWLVVLAALACPLGMLAMVAIAWVISKRASWGSRSDPAVSPTPDAARETAASAG